MGAIEPQLNDWREVCDYLVATYDNAVPSAGGDAVDLQVRVRLSLGGPGSQPTLVMLPERVQAVDVLGSGWLELSCILGSLRHLSPAEMLGTNMRTTIGALYVHAGQLAMRQMLPLAGLRVSSLEEAILEIARSSTLTRTQIAQLGDS